MGACVTGVVGDGVVGAGVAGTGVVGAGVVGAGVVAGGCVVGAGGADTLYVATWSLNPTSVRHDTKVFWENGPRVVLSPDPLVRVIMYRAGSHRLLMSGMGLL